MRKARAASISPAVCCDGSGTSRCSGCRPSQHIDALLPLIGWTQVRWDRRSIELPRAGMEIDFGGIGKEYAADRAGAALVEHGARHGFVNLGGDVRVIGPAPDGTPWRIAVQHPRGAAGEIARAPGRHERRARDIGRLRALLRRRWAPLLPHHGSAHGLAGRRRGSRCRSWRRWRWRPVPAPRSRCCTMSSRDSGSCRRRACATSRSMPRGGAMRRDAESR